MNDNKKEMYMLYMDYATTKKESISNEGYEKFIAKEQKSYKELYEPMIGKDDFLDCLKYKVLSEIARYVAKNENSTSDMKLWMNQFFRKYNIIDKTNENSILDVSMYNRIKNVYEESIEKKELDNIEKYIDILPLNLKDKYFDMIRPDYSKEGYEKYEDRREKKFFIENLKKLDNVAVPVKILVKYSESNIEYPNVYTLKEMNELCKKEEERIAVEKLEGKRNPTTYDKTKFFIIIDDGNKPYVLLKDQIDLGDNMQTDFYTFILKYYGYEKLKQLKDINNPSINTIGYIEECIIDRFNEKNDNQKWNLNLDESLFNKILEKVKNDDELAYVIDETVGASIVEVKEELENEEVEESNAK